MKTLIHALLGSVLILAQANTLFGEIVETNEISSVSNYTNEHSLVLFNVSDTLYSPSNTLANSQWREYFSKQVCAQVADAEKAQELILKTKNMIVNQIPKKPCESNAAPLIQKLQDQKQALFGITRKYAHAAYADNFADITYKHLVSVGVDFEKTLTYMAFNESLDEASETNYTLAHGILFTNKNPEGPAVAAFLRHMKVLPKNIVVIDNDLESLVNIENSLKDSAIPFVGLRYGRCDQLIQNFDPDLGTIQFLKFIEDRTLLSDEEAQQQKAQHPDVNYQALLFNYIIVNAQ